MTSSPSEVGRITLERVTFRYLEQSKRPVLDEVSASFDRSRITVLTGPSGCGKSTLLYLAAGIYPQNAGFLQGGTVRVEGQEPAALGPGERCALVGMLFQNPELQFCMDTVENELFFCLENRRVPRAEMEERLSAALDFCGIAHLRRRPLRSLSGGEKQRAALACLAALRPAWILLDEPFAIWTTKPPPFSADSSPGSTGNAAPAFGHRPPAGPLAVHRRRDPPHGPGRHAGRRRLCPSALSLRRGRSGASASPAAPTRPPGRSRPGRRRWCSPAGPAGLPGWARGAAGRERRLLPGAHPRHRGPQRQRQSTLFGASRPLPLSGLRPAGGWSCPGTAAG
ncbi:MAG: ABC transporter ATP-binding protein [Flavonifractor plautii]